MIQRTPAYTHRAGSMKLEPLSVQLPMQVTSVIDSQNKIIDFIDLSGQEPDICNSGRLLESLSPKGQLKTNCCVVFASM